LRLQLLPSVTGSVDSSLQHLTSILVNDSICLDAGSIGFHHDIELQRRVRHVFLSHSHIDHLASLPTFLDTQFGVFEEGVNLYGGEEVVQCLKNDIFNDRLWPDFFRISEVGPRPLLELHPLVAGVPVEADGVRITPVALDHLVPTFGFLVEEGETAAAFVSDTGPTEEIWQRCREVKGLKVVMLECAFPEDLAWLAEAAQHLTPNLLAAEIAKLDRPDCQLLTVHLKPSHQQVLVSQLGALEIDSLEAMEPGRTYEF